MSLDLKIGNRQLYSPSAAIKRITLLLWGEAGCGKTVLASTAPGKKLWLLFDPDGANSLAARDDVYVLPLFEEPPTVADSFKAENPLNITNFLKDNPDVETVVFDSITNFSTKALMQAVRHPHASSRSFQSTFLAPGLSAYGIRNAYVISAVKNLLQITGALGRNMIFIAHEDAPEKNSEGVVMYITTTLGGKLSNHVPADISEVWAMRWGDKDKFPTIAIRPCRLRKPMKSRMFYMNGEPEFPWHYNPDTQEGATIAGWVEEWREHGYEKIKTPKA